MSKLFEEMVQGTSEARAYMEDKPRSVAMELLDPDWDQARPTFAEVQAMCRQISLKVSTLRDSRLDSVLGQLRETHVNGGVVFASFVVGQSKVFDWFASRNQLPIFGILRQLLDRSEINSALSELAIQPLQADDPALVIHKLSEYGPVDPGLAIYGVGEDFEMPNTGYEGEFKLTSSFLFDGELASKLYDGGAYVHSKGNGRTEKENSLAFCEALFGLRFSEVSYYSTHSAWTQWFGNIAWDWTAILFDRRLRALSILAVTDTD